MRRAEKEEIVGGEGFTLICSRLLDLGSRMISGLLLCLSWPDFRIMPESRSQL